MKRKQIEKAITIWTRIVRGIKNMPSIMAQPTGKTTRRSVSQHLYLKYSGTQTHLASGQRASLKGNTRNFLPLGWISLFEGAGRGGMNAKVVFPRHDVQGREKSLGYAAVPAARMRCLKEGIKWPR
ncbi:MAG: hypothetical protein LJE93_17365 [Acidobacteria bacterium]|jgi:hypothetical protein|nr:hypothetical protein [Acidobacteriota bacterium]